MDDMDEQVHRDTQQLKAMGLPAAFAALDQVSWRLGATPEAGDSLDALFNRLAWHVHFAMMKASLAYDWTIIYGPSYARGFAYAAVLGAFPNELQVREDETDTSDLLTPRRAKRRPPQIAR